MGTIFKRGDSRFWWIGYRDVSGRRRLVSTETEDREEAEALLDATQRHVEVQVAAGEREDGPLTVERYSEIWLKRRRAKGIRSAKKDEQRLRDHALPVLGALELRAVRVRHLIELVDRLGEKSLSSRTIHHVYGVVKVLFSQGVRDELIAASPCVLEVKADELPPKKDKNPAWRPRARFSHAEVEQLISDTRIPFARRVVYAIRFLGGLRPGEVPTLLWADYERDVEPLGRLLVVSSVDSSSGKAKAGTKTGGSREVPVHPTLAKVLASWKLTGWREHQGRTPRPEDRIVPGADGGLLKLSNGYKRFQSDLALLGMRARRQHDTRATFITLALGDGAREDLLKWVTHPPDTSAFGGYTRVIPWPALCAEVAKLKISLPDQGQVIRLPVAAAGGATLLLRQPEGSEMKDGISVSRGGLEPPTGGRVATRHASPNVEASGGCAPPGDLAARDASLERSNVASVDPSVGCGR